MTKDECLKKSYVQDICSFHLTATQQHLEKNLQKDIDELCLCLVHTIQEKYPVFDTILVVDNEHPKLSSLL